MKISNILRRYSELKEGFGSIPTLTNQHSFKVSQFHKLLKNSYGKSLSKLQVRKDSPNEEISSSNNDKCYYYYYFQNMCLNSANKDVNYVCEFEL